MCLQIHDQDATGSVQFTNESITEWPTDPEAFLPDPQDAEISGDVHDPDSDANINKDGSTSYGVLEVDDDLILEDEEEGASHHPNADQI